MKEFAKRSNTYSESEEDVLCVESLCDGLICHQYAAHTRRVVRARGAVLSARLEFWLATSITDASHTNQPPIRLLASCAMNL